MSMPLSALCNQCSCRVLCRQEYDLYGVLVHQGHSMHSGHYFCFVKAPNGVWNRMDDSTVGQVRSRILALPLASTALRTAKLVTLHARF